MTIISYIFPQKIAEFTSKFNGKIFVKEFFGKKYIEVGGLQQSGRIPENLFDRGLRVLLKDRHHTEIKKILLLGIGGGTLIRILRKKYPTASIVGVEIDPVMVEVAKIYFVLDKFSNLQIIIGDVFDKNLDLGRNYDLIVVDLFRGYEIPQRLSDIIFLLSLRRRLRDKGTIIFNRLYFQKYKTEADKFLNIVRENFQVVKTFRNYFNILIQTR